jgi:hypothetical protein
MKSLIRDSLKDMREIGARLAEIERIRYRLRRANAPREAFLDLDSQHRAELASLKSYQKHFLLGLLFLIVYILMGLFGGVASMISFREDKFFIGIVSALCSICLLYLGKKELFE